MGDNRYSTARVKELIDRANKLLDIINSTSKKDEEIISKCINGEQNDPVHNSQALPKE